MTFGGEVYNCIGFEMLEQTCDQFPILNLSLDEVVPWIFHDCLERIQVSRVGQCIEIHHLYTLPGQQMMNKITAYETGPTGHNYRLHSIFANKYNRLNNILGEYQSGIIQSACIPNIMFFLIFII